jgi:hypothetical protein
MILVFIYNEFRAHPRISWTGAPECSHLHPHLAFTGMPCHCAKVQASNIPLMSRRSFPNTYSDMFSNNLSKEHIFSSIENGRVTYRHDLEP